MGLLSLVVAVAVILGLLVLIPGLLFGGGGWWLLGAVVWVPLIWNLNRLPAWAQLPVLAAPFVVMFWPLTQLLR